MISLFLMVALAYQPAETPLTFEVADIHNSAKARFPFMRGPSVHGDRYEVRNATMVDLIAAAYGVRAERVADGPSWLETDRFDVIAKVQPNPTPEAQKAMLQALLADRFKLVVHTDTRTVPAFALTAGKHPSLKKAAAEGESGCKFTPPKGPGRGERGPFMPVFAYSCHNMTMKAFADELMNVNASFQYLNEQPVVDQTGLEGAWDFDFKYSFRGGPMAVGDVITIFDAMEKQLGLKLSPTKVPMSVVVVDRVNQKPTDNVPGVTELLHETPPPTEFEVAEVKPLDPESRRMMFQIQRGGRVNMTGITLKFMIEQAWNITDEMLIGAPKWLDTDRYEIIAKAPTGEVDIDTVWVMLRALLKERFHLAVHNEERLISAYTLVSVKPKMKKADPASRTKFQEGPGADGKDPRNANPALSRLVTCQNMTMAQFAAHLQDIAGGYIHSPVLDATGVEGAWDFTLSFSPAGMGQGGRGGGGRGGDAPPPALSTEASEPTGGLTLFEAIEKQLGLKLEMQKRMLPVLVIDHIDQKPTDN